MVDTQGPNPCFTGKKEPHLWTFQQSINQFQYLMAFNYFHIFSCGRK